ncbi:hypothetical protein OIE67_35150 [Nonomuraea fuscirosea]|jgi:hypothetical protein|uniref:hypothetical protein n=1 Tax=Nonomuraea fuscirosea TaxID=1291556 RepID=UPI002DDBC68D|nr:hypothetical protein [Nonomuraea fuscirosea]WSA49293.1 hypothetical protein OIE67_35150 [Nonomuraea fuscirosea]
MEPDAGLRQARGRRSFDLDGQVMFGAGEAGWAAQGAGDATVAALRDVAGADLYRRNAFRITGVSTYANRRAVRERRQRVGTALQVGADLDLGHALPVGPGEVRAAFDRLLDDPRRRLVDELFWLWDTDDATCACVKSLHADHDEAVRAHCAALDREADDPGPIDPELKRLWESAAESWQAVLRRAAFWDHVRRRVAALDDRQLDESAVDGLRQEFATALLRPITDLAGRNQRDQARLASLARRWPAPSVAIDDQLETVAAPRYEAARTGLATANDRLQEGDTALAAATVYTDVLPELRRLDIVVPRDRHRRTAGVHNDTAILLNNCAMILMEHTGPASEATARKWLTTALDLSSDSFTKDAIELNEQQVIELVDTFNRITYEAESLKAGYGPAVADRFLLELRQQAAGTPGEAMIDKLRRDLGTDRGGYAAVAAPRRRRTGLKLAFWAVLVAGGIFLLNQCSAGSSDTAAPAVGRPAAAAQSW